MSTAEAENSMVALLRTWLSCRSRCRHNDLNFLIPSWRRYSGDESFAPALRETGARSFTDFRDVLKKKMLRSRVKHNLDSGPRVGAIDLSFPQ